MLAVRPSNPLASRHDCSGGQRNRRLAGAPNRRVQRLVFRHPPLATEPMGKSRRDSGASDLPDEERLGDRGTGCSHERRTGQHEGRDRRRLRQGRP